jgi:hypothetical protein
VLQKIFMAPNERRRQALTAEHTRAVAEFMSRARAVDAVQWITPRAAGKWTPSQEVRHLILTYSVFLRQLAGENPIRLRGTPMKRLVWRAIGLTSILWFKRIPVAVNAPREVRPDAELRPAEQLIPELESLIATFGRAFDEAWRAPRSHQLTHPLFGALSLDQGVRILTVHTRHHAAFLPRLHETR